MRAAHWLVGCALCLAGIGGVRAASVDSQDLDSSAHTLLDSASPHDATGSGGDATGLGHDCAPATSSDNSGTTPGSNRSGGSSSAPTPSRRPHLGWQSLLPGSIQ